MIPAVRGSFCTLMTPILVRQPLLKRANQVPTVGQLEAVAFSLSVPVKASLT